MREAEYRVGDEKKAPDKMVVDATVVGYVHVTKTRQSAPVGKDGKRHDRLFKETSEQEDIIRRASEGLARLLSV